MSDTPTDTVGASTSAVFRVVDGFSDHAYYLDARAIAAATTAVEPRHGRTRYYVRFLFAAGGECSIEQRHISDAQGAIDRWRRIRA